MDADVSTPEYEGEDTRPTSQKELWGFYAYGFAAEVVFVVCGVGSFIPITLEQLARDRGVLLSDHATPCGETQHSASQESSQCIVYILGAEINTASFALYVFSISVLLQALLIISVSGAADHGHYRKQFLVSFALTGAVATMLYILITPHVYIMGALLAIVSNICFGASFVLLNSFLPLLVRRHPGMHERKQTGHSSTGTSDDPRVSDEDEPGSDNHLSSSSAALLSTDVTSKAYPKQEALGDTGLQLSTKISSHGIGIGYLGAFVFQIFALVLVFFMRGTLFSLRIVLFFIGLWWLSFTIPAALWLRPRPGPLLRIEGAQWRLWIRYLTYSWKSLGRTLLRARKLRDVLWFLAAWFLLSDAIATVSSTAILFAKTTLQMQPTSLAFINVVVMVSGVLGAFFWRAASRALNLSPMGTVRACLALFAVIPLYALLGYISWLPIGLKHPWEVYPIAFIYGLVLGGLGSYCRSIFSTLIPPGFEASFYSLYAVTDKGSSVIGPAVVGTIIDRTGEIRPAFGFLAVLILLPGVVLAWVDLERGARDAKAAADVLVEE